MSKHSVLAYRNNGIWRSLADALLTMAEEGFDYCTVQIFPEGSSDDDILGWIEQKMDVIRGAAKVYSDGTVCRNLRRSFPEKYFGADLDNILGRAAELALKGRAPAEVYKEVFAALHAATGYKQVVIVLDNLADYNPLRLDGIKDSCGYHSKEQLQRYADAFARLLPNSVAVEVIRIDDLQPPDAHSFVLVHHHALNKHPSRTDFQSNPRVLMPYAQGLIPGINALCDISGIVDDAIVPAQQVIQDRRMW